MAIITHHLHSSAKSSNGRLKMGDVAKVDRSGVRTALLQGGEFRMPVVKIAYMRIDLRAAVVGSQVTVTLDTPNIRGLRQACSAHVLDVA